MIVSRMSEEFHEWLKSCPVHWLGFMAEEAYTEYAFENEGDEEE